MIRKLFDENGIKVISEKLIVNGTNKNFVKVLQADGVVILPILNNKILLERHYRRGIKKFVNELPAGHIKKKENRIDAVRRELLEETGYTSSKITFMFKASEAQPRLNNMLYFYLAEDLVKTEKNKNKEEIITSKLVSIKDFNKMISKNLITDLKTIAAYNYYKNM